MLYNQRIKDNFSFQCFMLVKPRWCSGTALDTHLKYRGLIPGRDRHKSLKQVVTTPLPNAQEQVFGDDHHEGLARITEGVMQLKIIQLKNQT